MVPNGLSLQTWGSCNLASLVDSNYSFWITEGIFFMSSLSRVYKNLNNGRWSIRQRVGGKWLVVGHCDACILNDVSTYISDARHNHVRKGHHREVFAWLIGDLVGVEGFTPYKGRTATVTGGFGNVAFGKARAITFHPFSENKQGFIYREGGDYRGSPCAYFTINSGVFA